MYIFRLWFATEREAIAREQVAANPVWAELRAKHPHFPEEMINDAFEGAVAMTAHNIHPLCILGLRRKIKK